MMYTCRVGQSQEKRLELLGSHFGTGGKTVTKTFWGKEMIAVTTKVNTDSLFEKFRSMIESLQGTAALVSRETVARELYNIISAENAKAIIGDCAAYLSELDLQTSLNQLGCEFIDWLPSEKPENFDEFAHRKKLANAELSISAADYLIAQTGTIVFLHQRQTSKLVTLLPPSVVVVVPASNLVADLEHLHQQLEKAKSAPDDITVSYFTGPSRTADIEKTLVLGVHGPKELYVLVVKD